MIRVAQAASSEHFSAWGEPPNQRRTGVTKDNPGGNLDGELNIVKFYGPWEMVFRPNNTVLAEKIAVFMEEAVKNGSCIGYGQNNGKYPRTGVFDTLKISGHSNPKEIKTLCNCDCSSLVGAAVYFAGAKQTALRDMWTGSMRSVLKSTGYFIELTDQTLLQSGQGIKRGDILWKTGHTAVALDTDPKQETVPAVIWNCSACNMRSGPGTNNKILKTLHPGDIVTLVSTASNGWGQIKVGSTYGYVSPLYFKTLPQMTATGNVWLRKGAGTASDKIIVIPQGAKPYVTGETKKVLLTTWYRAVYAGKNGWASGKYLKA